MKARYWRFADFEQRSFDLLPYLELEEPGRSIKAKANAEFPARCLCQNCGTRSCALRPGEHQGVQGDAAMDAGPQ
jgi:hypothetical protein